MFSAIRRRVTFANIAMTFALVFAMSGGAFAAGKFLITSTKQIKPSVLSSLKGKAGHAGAPGSAGPQGPAGPAGSAGKEGPQGPAGAAGAPGSNGEVGPEGKAGKDGKAGLPGSPWSVGGVLPSGSTETGVWAFGSVTTVQFVQLASFPIRLEHALTSGHAHFINAKGKEESESGVEVESTECEGTAEEPTAQPGNLCVYVAELTNAITGSSSIIDPVVGGGGSAGETGALLSVSSSSGKAEGSGTWAVTAE